MSTVEKLLRGSANLNQMQADIKQILKMLAGSIRGIGFTRHLSVEFKYPSSSYSGEEETLYWRMSGDEYYGVYHITLELGGYEYTDSEIYNLPGMKVKIVRESLDAFTDAFLEHYLSSKESLQYILEAAE